MRWAPSRRRTAIGNFRPIAHAGHWRARDPFPLGGVVEDPASGAAAAAFAGYLRTLGRARTEDRFTIDQGVEMGRPSRLEVELRACTVLVSGTAAKLV